MEYALLILEYVRDHELSSAKDIATQLSLPSQTCAKILQKLKSAKLLTSQQGVGGGYQLNCDLKQVSFLELHQLFENNTLAESDYCKDHQGKLCELFSSCSIKSPSLKLNSILYKLFNNLSIEAFLNNQIEVPSGS